MTTMHYRSIRMRNNAGIDMPECAATTDGPLDMDATAWPMTTDKREVTCRDCKRSVLRDPWHLTPTMYREWLAECEESDVTE